jgi:hypothetical protein
MNIFFWTTRFTCKLIISYRIPVECIRELRSAMQVSQHTTNDALFNTTMSKKQWYINGLAYFLNIICNICSTIFYDYIFIFINCSYEPGVNVFLGQQVWSKKQWFRLGKLSFMFFANSSAQQQQKSLIWEVKNLKKNVMESA